MVRGLLAGFILLIVIQGVLGVGFAPIAVSGNITNNGNPVDGAEISLKGFVDGVEVAQGSTSFSQEGVFFSMITVPDPSTLDIMIVIETDDVYVEMIEGARSWARYEVSLELLEESFGIPAQTVTSSAVPVEFDDDLRRIFSGEFDDELVEKYQLEVVEYDPSIEQGQSTAQDPIIEQPAFFPAPENEEDSSFLSDNRFWWILVSSLVLLAGVHFLLRRNHKSK